MKTPLPQTHITSSPLFHKILVVIKQTAYEEYSQLRLRGLAPKALRWKRLESRYKTHKSCVNTLRDILQRHNVSSSFINRVELDRQHLQDVDLVVSVGGDGTALSAAHFLDHGTIPLVCINSDPIVEEGDRDVRRRMDERRSHGALCMCKSGGMEEGIARILGGGGRIEERTRIRCVVKSTFSETRLVPALNDLLIAHPSPASVSRFRMGFLQPVEDDSSSPPPNSTSPYRRPLSSIWERATVQYSQYGTITRFGGKAYDMTNSLNVWSSGIWVSTPTGSTAAIAAAGGMPMVTEDGEAGGDGEGRETRRLQYLIREHMIEKAGDGGEAKGVDNRFLEDGEQLHLRWNSRRGKIYVDGSHMTHDLELGDEIMIDAKAPPLLLYVPDGVKGQR